MGEKPLEKKILEKISTIRKQASGYNTLTFLLQLFNPYYLSYLVRELRGSKESITGKSESNNTSFESFNNVSDTCSSASLTQPSQSLCGTSPPSNWAPTVYMSPKSKELMSALCQNDTQKIIKILEENKELINQQDAVYGFTPMHWAVRGGNTELANFLMSAGANTNIGSNIGQTPVHLAVIENNEKIFRILISKPSSQTLYVTDVTVRDYECKEPADYLSANSSEYISRMLLPRKVKETNIEMDNLTIPTSSHSGRSAFARATSRSRGVLTFMKRMRSINSPSIIQQPKKISDLRSGRSHDGDPLMNTAGMNTRTLQITSPSNKSIGQLSITKDLE